MLRGIRGMWVKISCHFEPERLIPWVLGGDVKLWEHRARLESTRINFVVLGVMEISCHSSRFKY